MSRGPVGAPTFHVCDHRSPDHLELWCRIWNAVRPDRALTAPEVAYRANLERRIQLWIGSDGAGRPCMALQLAHSRWVGADDPPELTMALVPPGRTRLPAVLAHIGPIVAEWGFRQVAVETRDVRGELRLRDDLAAQGFTLREADVESVLPLAQARRWDPSAPDGVRVVRLSDEPQLMASAQECFERADADEPSPGAGAALSPQAFLAELSAPWTSLEDCFIAVTDADQVVGWANLERFAATPHVGWNGFTGTHPDHRGKGIASVLKHAVVDHALACGLSELRTENAPANVPMRRLNLRLGYTPVATIEYWVGELSPS